VRLTESGRAAIDPDFNIGTKAKLSRRSRDDASGQRGRPRANARLRTRVTHHKPAEAGDNVAATADGVDVPGSPLVPGSTADLRRLQLKDFGVTSASEGG
jgi:hypothetical protein